MKTVEELLEEVEQHLSQPAADHIVSLIRKGEKNKALKTLLKEEGHWLEASNAKKVIDFLHEDMGPKTAEELFILFKAKPEKLFTTQELKDALTYAIGMLEQKSR